jgi:hypothetical protein
MRDDFVKGADEVGGDLGDAWIGTVNWKSELDLVTRKCQTSGDTVDLLGGAGDANERKIAVSARLRECHWQAFYRARPPHQED